MGQLLSFQDKLYLLLNISRPSACILFHSLFKIGKSLHCIMKIRDCLMKSICRIISKKALEITKCKSTLVKILVIFHLIKAGCIFYKQIRSPVFSLFIYKIRSSSTVIYDIQGFALCIPAIFQDFLLQPGGDTTDILHKTNRIFENLLVHFLENIALLSGFCGKYSTVSLINVAISEYANLFKFTAKIKAVDYFHQFLMAYIFCFSHLFFLPKLLRIKTVIFQLLNCSNYYRLIFFIGNSIPFVHRFQNFDSCFLLAKKLIYNKWKEIFAFQRILFHIFFQE